MPQKISKPREAVKHSIMWFILFFAFFPLYVMVVISFKDNKQFGKNPWLFDSISKWHWENWITAFNQVQHYIANSIVTSVGAVVMCLVMAVMASYVLARYKFPGRTVFYYALVASMFLPSTAATLVTLFTLLDTLHLVNSLWALVLCGAVGGQVVSVFILRQFIEDIPKELFESAQIDGAGHIQQIMHIVLPMSGSVMATLAIMQFLGSWNDLMLPLVIMRDDQLRTIPVGLMMMDGSYVKEWGPLMAGYAVASVPLVILFLFTMRLFVKGLAAGAVKG